MGLVKNVLMAEAMAPWWHLRENFVCGSCLADYALADVVKENVEGRRCDYCGKSRRRPFTTRLSIVVKHMYKCVRRDWAHPAAELPHESAEGGFQGVVEDGDDVLRNVDFCPDDSTNLFDDVASAFLEHPWCRRNYFGSTQDERLQHGWTNFKRVVRHERRFTFWSARGDDTAVVEHPPVGEMLGEIGRQIGVAGLVSALPVGARIWRVRVHGSDGSLKQDREFSPPPVELALRANRMSPAGVVMFYGADTFDTARIETVDYANDVGRNVTGVAFSTVRELRVLDLFELPTVPSYFDLERAKLFGALVFLRAFTADLAAPPGRGSAEIDYVPTQAFTEYVRFELKDAEDKPVDGIRYRSSRNGQACYVLFCGSDQCIDHPNHGRFERWLRWNEDSIRTEPV